MMLHAFLPLLNLGGLLFGLVAGLRLLAERRRPKLSPNVMDLLSHICHDVIHAIEQMHPDMTGTDKKQLATRMVGDILAHDRRRMSATLIDSSIEAAVFMFHRYSRNPHKYTVPRRP